MLIISAPPVEYIEVSDVACLNSDIMKKIFVLNYETTTYFYATSIEMAKQLCEEMHDTFPVLKAEVEANDAYNKALDAEKDKEVQEIKERLFESTQNLDHYAASHRFASKVGVAAKREIYKIRNDSSGYKPVYPTELHYTAKAVESNIGWEDDKEACIKVWMSHIEIMTLDSLV